MIRLTNSQSGVKEEFVAIHKNKVGMYHCGPTVYDYVHIGNLRSFVTADIVRRVFEFNGYEVNQVMNITDVGIGGDNDEGEDKIIRGLKREDKPITLNAMTELTAFYTERFKEELRALNIKTPNHFPKASEHIQEDIEMIEVLDKKGAVYTTHDGVYFDTSTYPAYGKLGGIAKDGADTQARIDGNSEKKNQKDFAVWKFNTSIGYTSPWGQGFPGWHIECSAMSKKYLGEHFDIHTGGIDLLPIHHNNEIAQSETACDCEFVNYWLHNAFVNVDGGKMAKSLGNFLRLSSLAEKNISPLAYRYFLLSAHYRTPVMFSWEAMEGAHNAYTKLAAQVLSLGEAGTANATYVQKFTEYVNDDLDTAKGLALMWDVLKDTTLDNAEKKATVLEFDNVLGLGLADLKTESVPKEIEDLAREREVARENKEWDKADTLRADILAKGYEMTDTDSGPELRKK